VGAPEVVAAAALGFVAAPEVAALGSVAAPGAAVAGLGM
jgi:hypothetical protein